jgi:hypothetical protein
VSGCPVRSLPRASSLVDGREPDERLQLVLKVGERVHVVQEDREHALNDATVAAVLDDFGRSVRSTPRTHGVEFVERPLLSVAAIQSERGLRARGCRPAAIGLVR